MRVICPKCGERDLKEFSYQGDALALGRPDPDADEALWNDYLHNRDNPSGVREDLWFHVAGCSAWIVVTRNTATHEILKTELATSRKTAEEGKA